MARHAAVTLSLALLALGAASAAQFNYTSPNDFWPVLFPTCGSGQVQSPINVDTNSVVQLCSSDSDSSDDNDEDVYTIQFRDWGEAEAEAENVGQTFEVKLEEPSANIRVPVKGRKVFGVVKASDDSSDDSSSDDDYNSKEGSSSNDDDDDVKFALATPLQFHFHTPSENTINGVHFAMEVHVVASIPTDDADCWDSEGIRRNCLVVFATLFEESTADVKNTFLASLFDGDLGLGTASIDDASAGTYGNWAVSGVQTSATADQDPKALDTLRLADLMPSNMDYYYWNGSLTTPQCNETVTWVLFQNPQSVANSQVQQVQTNAFNNRNLCITDCTNGGGSDPACQLLCLDVGATENNRPTQDLNNRVVTSSIPKICPEEGAAVHLAGRKVNPGIEQHTLTVT